jgi:methyl-accepting chemotaxis protein
MRIARLIFIVIALLGGVGVFLAAQRLWTSHNLLIAEQRMSILSNARSLWLEGAVALSLERSVTQVALALDTTIPSGLERLIADQRRISDALFDDAGGRLETMDSFKNRDVFMRQISVTRAEISALRDEADRLLSETAAERDTQRASQLPYDLKSTIEKLAGASSLLVLPEGSSSSEEVALTRIQELAWEIREYGGRARTYYAIATLTDTPIPERFFGEAAIDTFRAVSSWDHIETKRSALALPEELNAALAALKGPFAETYLGALAELDAAMQARRAGNDTPLPFSFEAFFDLSSEGLDAVAAIVPLAGTHIQSYWADELKQAAQARLFSAIVVVLVFVLATFTMLVIYRKLTQPLAEATNVLHDMANGNIDRQFRQTERGLDELRVIWKALEALVIRLRAARDTSQREREAEARAKQGIVGDLMKGLERMADGDFTYTIGDTHGQAYSALVENFNRTGATLRQVIGNFVRTAEEISEHSRSLGAAVVDLSHRSEDQMRIVGDTARSLRAQIDALRETAQNIEESLKTVSEAAHRSDASRAVVDKAMSAMDEIRASSDSINGFGSIIDDIAFQTNLLSLNAGVEAARAGDAGRGFAVVAQEVRSLAGQASSAARDVKQQVETSRNSIVSGVDEVSKAGQALEDISAMVGAAHERIEQIDRASRLQSETLEGLGVTVEKVDAISRQNAEMAVEAASNSTSLQQTAKALRESVARFRIGAPEGDVPARGRADTQRKMHSFAPKTNRPGADGASAAA